MITTDASSPVSWAVGTCGISDSDWIGNFYPRGLQPIDRLAYYAGHFNSIELNTTFHAIPARKVVQRWREVTPAEFRFCIKFPEDVTHGSPERLSEAGTIDTAVRFFDVISELREKLSVVLMQFPPWFSAKHRSTLLRFIDRIRCPARLVVEFRHYSWWTPATAMALRERHIGWATADLASCLKSVTAPPEGQLRSFGLTQLISTSDFLYARLIGKHHQFLTHREERFDSMPRLTWWSERLKRVLAAYPDVRGAYVFFDNDFSGHAPNAATRFADLVHLPRAFEASFQHSKRADVDNIRALAGGLFEYRAT